MNKLEKLSIVFLVDVLFHASECYFSVRGLSFPFPSKALSRSPKPCDPYNNNFLIPDTSYSAYNTNSTTNVILNPTLYSDSDDEFSFDGFSHNTGALASKKKSSYSKSIVSISDKSSILRSIGTRKLRKKSGISLEYSNDGSFSIASPPQLTFPQNETFVSQYAATDIATLRDIFGTNRNKLWGDLDVETGRKLYHILLPRALIRLHSQGIEPSELAPLAYEARVAAKEYVRERSKVPSRMMAVTIDGFRHLKNYGKWRSKGVTWDELWAKYERQVLEEELGCSSGELNDDVISQICLRILEKSCQTNKALDRLILSNKEKERIGMSKNDAGQEVLEIATKLDNEINVLLNKQDEMLEKCRFDSCKKNTAEAGVNDVNLYESTVNALEAIFDSQIKNSTQFL